MSLGGGLNVALKITNREVDGVAVVALDGRIVLGEESNALRESIKSLLAANKKQIVLNMDNVTYIDSAGLGALVAAHHSARSQNASLRLSNLGSKFQEVLQVTKLLTVFEVFDSEAAAIRSFSK
jgi:anti-sigma B factor antagonist